VGVTIAQRACAATENQHPPRTHGDTEKSETFETHRDGAATKKQNQDL